MEPKFQVQFGNKNLKFRCRNKKSYSFLFCLNELIRLTLEPILDYIQFLAGVSGYTHIYQRLANELLPPDIRPLYVERELVVEDTMKNSSQRSTNENSENSDGIHWSRNMTRPYSETQNNSTDIIPKTTIDRFSVAELQALMLLHFVNRTLAGGHCFEKVINVFGNDELSLVVPNSKAAQPLDIIVPRNFSGNPTAILRSHTSFRVFPSGATPDPHNCYADVDAHFMSDVDIASVFDESMMYRVCKHLVRDLELDVSSTDSTETFHEMLPKRLVQYIRAGAVGQSRPTDEVPFSTVVNYRIYLNCNTSTTSGI